MLVKVHGGALWGIDARLITIEVDISPGISFYMVGLPDSAVRESHHRIDAALKHFGYRIPGRRIVVNMAPADIRKEGTAYDLPIALGILAASGQIKTRSLEQYVIMGELSLDGELKPVRGALTMAEMAVSQGFRGLIIPRANVREASWVQGIEVYGADRLDQLIHFFQDESISGAGPKALNQAIAETSLPESQSNTGDCFSQVKGQENAKRAMEVAAAGDHNLLFTGSPGSGKTMLARRMPGILPPLTIREALEVTRVYSVAGKLPADSGLMSIRPFRNPHHSCGAAAIIGGGAFPRPGEASLAHRGILFLDELAEFRREVLEVLRQPLEDKEVRLSRSRCQWRYPASFMLVAAMNPCPCGHYNHPSISCLCNPGRIKKYLSRVSGPLLDRIDIQLEVTPVDFHSLYRGAKPETSQMIRQRVIRARKIQQQRYTNDEGIYANGNMSEDMLEKYAPIPESGRVLLKTAMERLGLSARAYVRIRKMARTIADLDEKEKIDCSHLAEAIHYRSLDRKSWGEITL